MNSVLDPEKHKRLLADLPGICSVARIPQRYVHETMVGRNSDEEIDFVRHYRTHLDAAIPGLVIVGATNPQERCMGIVGALLRNYIDARLWTVNDLLDKTMGAQEATVLCIPDFFVGTKHGKQFASHEIRRIHSALIGRQAVNRMTVLCINDGQGVMETYGSMIHSMLSEGFIRSKS